MGPEALEFEEVESWLDYATQNPNQPLYIRYVGRCTGPTTPVDRHLEDIAHAATLFELNAAHYQAGTATARDIDLPRYNREATDTINNPMSHDYIEAIANQATLQRLINDRLVSIIIGKDVTLNAFNNPSRFRTNDPGYSPTLT
ncbi:hypothetical protein BDC45DRAFT_576575 [Circinella umbellata]|nr:hypothetical protein BDC45DRAFT_576575 [Circinella umbellata]